MTTPAEVAGGGGGGPELTAKYQKLATEYAKLRAQSAVLKRGLLEEQDRAAGLQDQINQRDTALRKAESEMEAVLFRNQQLSVRVDVLQQEAEAAARGKKGSRWRRDARDHSHDGHMPGSGQGDSAEAVINEELVAKITENASLRMKLGDIEATFEATVQALRERCEELEKEKIELGCGQRARETEASSEAVSLREERAELGRRLEAEGRELAAREERIGMLQGRLEEAVTRCSALEAAAMPPACREAAVQYDYVEEGAVEAREAAEREREGLGRRLERAEGRAKELERDREHWRLECQLGALRLEKAKQEGEAGLGATVAGEAASTELEEVVAMREEELKGVWEGRIEELAGDRLLADSRAVALSLELEAAMARLLSRRKEGERLEQKAGRLEREEVKLKEEAASTAATYEAQLSVMSEHLASMNSRLAGQEDVIQELRHELANPAPGGKRGRK